MFTLNCKGRLLTIDEPIVMGIINVTPDSFYHRSRADTEMQILRKAEQMLLEGAAILDLGGQSTRPGSTLISAGEELQRLIPAIELIIKNFPDAIISVDSFYARVAKLAIEAGGAIINDISGGHIDPEIIPLAAQMRVPYICMHMRGTPQTMNDFTSYKDLMGEITDYFIERIRVCQDAGIHDLILDPGIGFSKTIAQNFEILNAIPVLKIPGKPLLIGVSRKGTIYKTLGIDAEKALNGTTVLNTIAILNGASILRVHDVKEALEAVKLCSEIKKASFRMEEGL